MDPFLEIPSILPSYIDLDAHRAVITHRRLASLTTWAAPSPKEMAWFRSCGVPPELLELLSVGLPSRGRDADAGNWTIYTPQSIREVSEVDPRLLRSRLLPIGECFYEEPHIVLDLAGPLVGTVCFIDRAMYLKNVPPFPRAYMRVICPSLTAFFVGVAKDAIPTGPYQLWSESNRKGTWRYDDEPTE